MKRADCRRTSRLIIKVSLGLELGVVGGQNCGMEVLWESKQIERVTCRPLCSRALGCEWAIWLWRTFSSLQYCARILLLSSDSPLSHFPWPFNQEFNVQ